MLENYLKEKSTLQAGKIRVSLEKVFNFSSLGVMTLAQAIEVLASKPECKIDCNCGTSRKRDGLRYATKPQWSILTMQDDGYMSGPVIPKVAAEYANWLMDNKFDVEALQKNADEVYAKEGKAGYETSQKRRGISSIYSR